jgi:hypothetical protein
MLAAALDAGGRSSEYLGDPEDIIVLVAAREAESAVKKHLGSKPTIAETENLLWPREVHLRLPFSADPPPRCPPPKRPLSFAAMLRQDEGEGVLLTELACQSDWRPTDRLTQAAGSSTLQAALEPFPLPLAAAAGLRSVGPGWVEPGNRLNRV